jgi:hypothetical protein
MTSLYSRFSITITTIRDTFGRVDGPEGSVAADGVVVGELPPHAVTPTTTSAVVMTRVRA